MEITTSNSVVVNLARVNPDIRFDTILFCSKVALFSVRSQIFYEKSGMALNRARMVASYLSAKLVFSPSVQLPGCPPVAPAFAPESRYAEQNMNDSRMRAETSCAPTKEHKYWKLNLTVYLSLWHGDLIKRIVEL
jgi:hypothetical protein